MTTDDYCTLVQRNASAQQILYQVMPHLCSEVLVWWRFSWDCHGCFPVPKPAAGSQILVRLRPSEVVVGSRLMVGSTMSSTISSSTTTNNSNNHHNQMVSPVAESAWPFLHQEMLAFREMIKAREKPVKRRGKVGPYAAAHTGWYSQGL